ncbi:MAG TPA: hypothetical protein VGW78_05140 [Candidatus Babeliales bacterium]|nr:hypothetical protein [Candidatus Babeliales bacterium]
MKNRTMLMLGIVALIIMIIHAYNRKNNTKATRRSHGHATLF